MQRTGNVDIVTMALNLFTQGVGAQSRPTRRQRDQREDRRALQSVAGASAPPLRRRTGLHRLLRIASGRGERGLRTTRKSATIRCSSCPTCRWTRRTSGATTRRWCPLSTASPTGGMAYILRADHGLDLPRSLQVKFSKIAQSGWTREGGGLTAPELWALVPQGLPSRRRADDADQAADRSESQPGQSRTRRDIAQSRTAQPFTIEGRRGQWPDRRLRRRAKGRSRSSSRSSTITSTRWAAARSATAASYVEIQDTEGRALHGVGHRPERA